MRNFIAFAKNSALRTWRTIRITHKVAANISLVIVALLCWQVSHGQIIKFDGVAHAEMPFGSPQQAMIAALPADQVLPPQAMLPIPDKIAKVSFRTGGVPPRKPMQ